MKDQANDLRIVNALTPALYGAADVNGADVDRAPEGIPYEAVTFAVTIGAEGDTLAADLYIQLEMEHGDATNAYADCGASDIIVPKDQSVVLDGTSSIVFKADAGTEAPVVFKVGYKGGKRYSRLVYNKEGTHTNGTPAAAVAILGRPGQLPVAA